VFRNTDLEPQRIQSLEGENNQNTKIWPMACKKQQQPAAREERGPPTAGL